MGMTKLNQYMNKIILWMVLAQAWLSFCCPRVFYIHDASEEPQGEDPGSARTHYGVSAQELQQLFPDLVEEGQDGYLAVNYQELIPICATTPEGTGRASWPGFDEVDEQVRGDGRYR